MIVQISKIGMIISLFLVVHALVYPNRFSLYIAIFGYIFALVSAVIYGLCKSETRQVRLEELSEKSPASSSEFNPRNVTGVTQKLFLLGGSPSLGGTPKVVSGTFFSRPPLENMIDIEADINKIVYKIPARRYDDLEILRKYTRDPEIEENEYKENIPGYQ